MHHENALRTLGEVADARDQISDTRKDRTPVVYSCVLPPNTSSIKHTRTSWTKRSRTPVSTNGAAHMQKEMCQEDRPGDDV